MVNANKGKRGFTYTHYEPKGSNKDAIKLANDKGFTINLSANNLNHADKLAALNIAPVTVVVAEDTPEHSKTPQGRHVVICPAQTERAANCEACGLCQKQQRGVIVGFRAHGVSRRKAEAVANG